MELRQVDRNLRKVEAHIFSFLTYIKIQNMPEYHK